MLAAFFTTGVVAPVQAKATPGLFDVGVQPGTLLFKGTSSGKRYVGTAFQPSVRPSALSSQRADRRQLPAGKARPA
jgi:hypothetical protein